ncbi:LEC14B protein-like [Andrographis paniculata]|uniref:LEC14B protein-like n=1 Tax=Andrographis paniculata TaxID=175694 RepID=UPI0021E6F244|nr:LEC14B protein-like [Andrographis paniculata]XP_051118888.1 LEC14B protein-like [Andrographis paniculata]
MLFIDQDIGIENMGYTFSKLEVDSGLLDGSSSSSNNGVDSSPPHKKQLNVLDNDIVQLTKLRSEPHDHFNLSWQGKLREYPISTVKMLAGREANVSGRGRFSSRDFCHVVSKYLPVNGPWVVDQMSTRAYVSQFSSDGSRFVAAFQGSQIRVYDVDRGWKVQKNILAQSLRWTITDTSLSPDQRYLVYASMSPIVHIVNVDSATRDSHANITEIHDGLDFSSPDGGGYSFGIFSLKFSTDGRELVAGSSDEDLYVYDLEANKLSLQIPAHTSDVNTVCFADESGNLIYSGSDDNFCKVWDRRCLRAKGKPAGVLMGHLEGITFIDSRKDGRYLISNGKDQAIKLWDIRKMSSLANCYPGRNYEWDYRWMDYPQQARDLKHPYDQSVATYKGHSVLRTLIRCYFSPEYSTGQKYIYTGSHDSCVYVYDLVSRAQVAKLQHHKSTVRDCSWHPTYPMLVSSSWDGDVVKWEFPGNGESPVPANKKKLRRRHFY